MEEGGERFLPCCYGHATTIRRAQGASLGMGCIYFDQKYRCAGRGYGYVATSRFRTREGSVLYGHMRRTGFLPVGGEGDSEVLERGYDSLSDEDEDGRGVEHACEDNLFQYRGISFRGVYRPERVLLMHFLCLFSGKCSY